MPSASSKPKRPSPPKRRCLWCPNYMIQHALGRRKVFVCYDCDMVPRWPNV